MSNYSGDAYGNPYNQGEPTQQEVAQAFPYRISNDPAQYLGLGLLRFNPRYQGRLYGGDAKPIDPPKPVVVQNERLAPFVDECRPLRDA